MRLYFDANASTPIDPRVLDLYLTALKTGWANPSSVHQEGQRARNMLGEARSIIASLFHVEPRQIVFFSSATEALNTLLVTLHKQKKGKLCTTDIEHSALYEPAKAIKNDIEYVSVGKKGSLSPDAIRQDGIGSVATFLVNNETGILTDVKGVNEYTAQRSLPLLLDGVAALGKVKLPTLQGTWALCFASHKVYSPKGVGLAVLSSHFPVEPLVRGGKQESGRRAGTENVPAIWAFAQALQFLFLEQTESIERQTALREAFEENLTSTLGGVSINGEGMRVSNVSNLFIEGVEGEELLMLLDQQGVALSAGAACSSGAMEPSRVITRMYSRERALSSIRISMSKFTTSEEVDILLSLLKKTIQQLRR